MKRPFSTEAPRIRKRSGDRQRQTPYFLTSNKFRPHHSPQVVRRMTSNVNHSKIVRLNVGGTLYDVARDTLDRCSGSMLASLVSARWTTGSSGDSEIIFIDRNGFLFQYVLDYLRNNKLHLPCSVSRAAVKDEFDYCGISADMNHVITDQIGVAYTGALTSAIRAMQKDLSNVETNLATRTLQLTESNETLKSRIRRLTAGVILNTLAMSLGSLIVFGGLGLVIERLDVQSSRPANRKR